MVIQVSGAPTTEILVDTLEDEMDANDGSCSLREAITAANNNSAYNECPAGESSAPDTITFSLGGTISLTEVLTVSAAGPLVIDGGGVVTLSGHNSVRVLEVGYEADLTLENITVSDGYDTNHGGGIYNMGTLTITNSTFSGNSARDYSGGGIYNDGTLTIANSNFSSNYAPHGGGILHHSSSMLTITGSNFSNNNAILGGGIFNVGSSIPTMLTVTSSHFTDNTGGGIYNAPFVTLDIKDSTFTDNTDGGIINSTFGTLTITNSTLSGNQADYGGGIYIDYSGTLNITNSTLSGNSAHFGGGINNNGTVSVTHSTFSNNSADQGGGIYNNNNGTLNIANSTFSSNRVEDEGDGGGGISNFGSTDITNSTFYTNTATDHYGGGIYNDYSGTLNIANSTLSGNSAGWGGGIDNRGPFTITHSALVGNNADFGGGIYNEGVLNNTNNTFSANTATQYGGGISNWTGTVNLTNSTFSGNSAPTALTATGGAVDNSGTMTITNSILANSPSGDNCKGAIIDGGHNLEDGVSCEFSIDALSNTNPWLAPLGDNGGPTWTYALMQGSLAIDSADPANCPSTDQRGAPRPFDGNGDGVAICDRGSFEAGYRFPTTTTITGETPDPSFMNQPFTVTFAVTSTFGTPSGVVTVTVSDTEESCTDTLLSNATGSCVISLEAQGTYTLTATYSGDENFLPSSDSELHTVNKADTVTTITDDAPDPSLVNQPFTVTFSVSSTFGLPTGVVSVTVSGSEENCSDTLAEGLGQCQLSISTAGTYTVSAAYPGNDIYSPSSDSVLHDVIQLKIFLPLTVKAEQP